METIMKKFILAAALIAPLGLAVPALAQGVGDAGTGNAGSTFSASGTTTYVPSHAREFSDQRQHRGRAGTSELEQSLIDRMQVPDPSRLPAY